MKMIKIALSVIALALAGSASASVYHTNTSDVEQTLTIVQRANYSYYGFDNWSTSDTFTVVVAPGETLSWDDYFTTHGDGGSYSEVYELVGVE